MRVEAGDTLACVIDDIVSSSRTKTIEADNQYNNSQYAIQVRTFKMASAMLPITKSFADTNAATWDDAAAINLLGEIKSQLADDIMAEEYYII